MSVNQLVVSRSGLGSPAQAALNQSKNWLTPPTRGPVGHDVIWLRNGKRPVRPFLAAGESSGPLGESSRPPAHLGILGCGALPAPRHSLSSCVLAGERTGSLLGRSGQGRGRTDRERRFVDDASHGLRTPLAVLKAELDLAQSRSRTNQELQAAVRSAAEEADRLTALAETLLVFSRAEGGRVPLHRRQARLDELLQAACSALAARASAAGVDVRVVPYGVTAFADAVLVRQVVENVVSNALGHTPTRRAGARQRHPRRRHRPADRRGHWHRVRSRLPAQCF